MAKYTRIVKNIVLTILFLGLFIMMLARVMYVFREKSDNLVQDRFAALEPDSVDTVFIGTSHQFCSIDADLLYEEYHINSFMLATSAQTVPMSYYAAMEAIELQHPEKIVFEVLYCTNDFRTVTPEMSHTFFDGMPMCKARKMAIDDLIEPKQRIYYYLNFGRYHSRWKNLTQDDFQVPAASPRGTFYSEKVAYNQSIPVIPREGKEEMTEEMFLYFEKLVELCRENNVKLILYAAPFNALYDDESMREDLFRRQRIFNWIGDYAMQEDIPFHNLFYELDEIGLDGERDFMDTQHLNCYGQEKLTRYMAEKGYFD